MDSVAGLRVEAIRVAQELVRVCDLLGQGVAGNHFAMGIDLLHAGAGTAVGADLAGGPARSAAVEGGGDQGAAPG